MNSFKVFYLGFNRHIRSSLQRILLILHRNLVCIFFLYFQKMFFLYNEVYIKGSSFYFESNFQILLMHSIFFVWVFIVGIIVLKSYIMNSYFRYSVVCIHIWILVYLKFDPQSKIKLQLDYFLKFLLPKSF